MKRLNEDRLWRARELSDVRALHNYLEGIREKTVTSRCIVLLSYAHWEGYCASCIHTYIDYLEAIQVTYAQIPPNFALGAVTTALDSYRDRADNLQRRLELVNALKDIRTNLFSGFDRKVVLPRSNLNFERLKFIFSILDLDISPFQRHRIRIDKELVGWRHPVAHGEMFILDHANAQSHTQFAEELMFIMKTTFEGAIYTY